MTTQRRKLIIVGILALVLLGIILLLVNPIRSLRSFQKIEGYPFYSMTFYGKAYDYLRFTVPQSEEDIKNISLVSPARFQENQACTVFSATGGEKMIYGRNRDLYDQNVALLLYTDPPGGYKSLSIVDVNQLGLNWRAIKDQCQLVSAFF